MFSYCIFFFGCSCSVVLVVVLLSVLIFVLSLFLILFFLLFPLSSVFSPVSRFCVALVGGAYGASHANEASLLNLDDGTCEHVFRVLPQIVSDRTAHATPTLESIPLRIDPCWSKTRSQGVSTSAARDFTPSSGVRDETRVFGRRKRTSARDVGMRAMLWTPSVLPGAASPQLITAGADTVRLCLFFLLPFLPILLSATLFAILFTHSHSLTLSHSLSLSLSVFVSGTCRDPHTHLPFLVLQRTRLRSTLNQSIRAVMLVVRLLEHG